MIFIRAGAYYIMVQWVEKHISICDIIDRPRNSLTIICKDIIVYS